MFEAEYIEALEEPTTDKERAKVLSLHLRRVSHLLHDIRNKSTNTVKSGKYANVKNAKKNLPLTLQQRKDLIDKSIMADDNDESDEEEENEDLHDLEMSKIFEKVINVET
uniref:Uncharacterized protein n=1 Tax=Panagrolaimus sp. ES5 TaxID=591445 RepID=A0AC34GC49_9BILA